MSLTAHRTFVRLTTAAIPVLLLWSCRQSVDLSAVQNLATTASQSEATFNALAGDYYDSCERRNLYASIGSEVETYIPKSPPEPAPTRTPKKGEVAPQLSDNDIKSLSAQSLATRVTTISVGKLTLHQKVLVAGRPDAIAFLTLAERSALTASLAATQPPQATLYNCTDEHAASIAWQQANGVVVSYFAALGKLAGTGNASSTDAFGMKALAAGIAGSKASGMTTTQAASIGTLADGVIEQIYDAKRRGELSKYIPTADAAVQNAIKTLEGLATDHYAFALTQEQKTANEFFERNIQLAQPGEQAFEVLAFSDEWSSRMQELDAKRAAIQSYVNAWDALGKDHSKLLAAINNDDSASALAIAEGIYAAISPDITAIQKAYAKGAK